MPASKRRPDHCPACGSRDKSDRHFLPFKMETVEAPSGRRYKPGEWIADVPCGDPWHDAVLADQESSHG